MKKTKPELRVEIAKDVLKHIEAGKILAKHGRFWKPKITGQFCNKPLRETMERVKKCEVCAVGSIFYSYVMRHNKYVIDGWGIKSISDMDVLNTATMFTRVQLRLIETAFEKNDYSWGDLSVAQANKAISYRDSSNLQNDEETLIHIMKNIIKHGGTFKP